jgi:hypothetical protein
LDAHVDVRQSLICFASSKGETMTRERAGTLKGAAIAMVVGLGSAIYNSVFSGAWASAGWLALAVGYFGIWALLGGAIGYWGAKRNASKS